MSLAKVYWTRKVAFVLAISLPGLYGAVLPRAVVADTPTVELPTKTGKQVAAGVEITPTTTGRFQVVFNGQYDPKSNPEGYTGSAIMLPEGYIWKKTVDATGRHVYTVDGGGFSMNSSVSITATTSHCVGSGPGVCNPRYECTCTVSISGSIPCTYGTKSTQQKYTLAANKKYVEATKAEVGGGLLVPKLLAGKEFPSAKKLANAPYKLLRVTVKGVGEENKNATQSSSGYTASGKMKFTISDPNAVALRNGTKEIPTDGLDISGNGSTDLRIYTNDSFTSPVTVTASLEYTVTTTSDGTTKKCSCSDSIRLVPCKCPPPPPIPPCTDPCPCSLAGSIPGQSYTGTATTSGTGTNPNQCQLYQTSRSTAKQGFSSNFLMSDVPFSNGVNQIRSDWPFVTPAVGETAGTLMVVLGSERVYWFNENNDVFTARYGSRSTLTHDVQNAIYVFTSYDGTVYEFHDLDQTAHPQGLFKRSTAPNGQVTEVTSYVDTDGDGSEDRIAETRRTTSGSIESTVYAFSDDLLQSATLRRSTDNGSTWTNINRTAYTYYATNENYGNAGDLKTSAKQLPNGQGGWATIDTRYYRYWKDGETDYDSYGYLDALKFVFEPEGYRQLVAQYPDPSQATDSQVKTFATHYYEYDPDTHRVTRHKLYGETQDFTTTYINQSDPEDSHYNSNYADGPNNWKLKTVESWTDSSQAAGSQTVTRTIYTNYLGQPLVKDLQWGTSHWTDYYQYSNDSNSRLVLHAEPSAVAGYVDNGGTGSCNLVVSFKLDANNEEKVGLVHTYSYYDTSGKLQYENVRHGNAGADIRIRENIYASHTYNNVTVYNPEKFKVFPGELESSQPNETSFAYTYHANSNAIAERVTTLPAIGTTHNGSGTANVRKEYLDIDGHVVWSKDERGSFTYSSYDSATGAVVQTIQDVKSGQGLTPPTGWGDLPAAGLHVVTDYTHDTEGRITQTLGPAHLSPLPSGEGQGEGSVNVRTASWTVYDEANHTTRTAQGYQVVSTGAYTLVNPVSITKTDADGRVTEQIQAVRGSGVTSSGALSSSDTFAQSSYVRWSVNTYSNTLLTSSRVYHLIPSSGEGTAGTNYAETTYTYDSVGRIVKTVAPNGTIYRNGLDIRGQLVWSKAGTTEENLVLLTENQYDGGGCSCGANGNITQTTQYVDASTTRVTSFTYDWRDRRLTTSASDGTTTYITYNTYDNLNHVTQVDQYHTAVQDANLVARQKTCYDELGRVYKTETYAVDPSTGTVGTALASNTWYDASGNAIKQKSAGSSAFTKTAYNTLGRAVKRYVGYDTTETDYADAGTVIGDTIFEQIETTYDAAGNVIAAVNRSRLHDATGTGELTDSTARTSYAATWYDPLGRQTAIANYGTNGGTAPTRPNSTPACSDTVLVSSTDYNASGEAYSATDPSGKVSRREFDALGRATKTIQNYVDGNPSTGNADEDITMETAYTIDGQISTLTAKNSTTSDQVTKYVYGTTLSDSGVARADLLRGVIYPDSDDTTSLGSGSDGVYDHIEYKYNRLGQVVEMTDQNGTVHAYVYDGLGRQTADKVTTVGTGVDDSVRRIARTYEVRGMTEHITSYDAASDGNVVNDVLREYDTLGRMTKEYQEHSGAKDANTLYVETAYENIATALRPTSVRYPNGRHTYFDYSSTDDTRLNRLTKILDSDDSTSLAEYTYLGAGTMVVEDFVQPQVKLDYFGGTSGTYAGFDRFGRVIRQLWYDYGASANRDKFTYGYNRASNRIYREHSLATLKDEFYSYDGVNQLIASQRGTLTQNKDGISGTPSREEDFALDPIGNWTAYVHKTDGTTDLNQTRTHNTANELTAASSWATPVHDRAGNITTVPKPSSLANGLTLKYDAWNRLVQVTDGEIVVAKYEYDGENRRIKKHIDSQSPFSPDGIDRYEHLFYDDVQLVEIRNTTTEGNQPENLQPKYQWVWSPRYIDSPMLRDENMDNDSLCDDSRIYFTTDANMNVTSLVDTSGDALERYVYGPYGHVTIYNADWSFALGVSSCSNSILYSGRDIDRESGLYYYRARYYSPELGRFVCRDPVESEANLYRYCYNDPLTYSDPLGTKPGDCAFNIQITPPRTISAGKPLPFGLSGSVAITQSSVVKTKTCEVCCNSGVTGHTVSIEYNASYTVGLSATKKWGIISEEVDDEKLSTKLLQAGVRANLTASVTIGLDLNFSYSTCPGVGGVAPRKVCSTASGNVSANVTARSQTLLWKAEASVVGSAMLSAKVCANINANGGISVGQPEWSLVNAGLGYKLTWTGPLGRHWNSSKVRGIL